MSYLYYNLFVNGDFSNPSIMSGYFINYSSFTTDMKNNFLNWNSYTDLSLASGITNYGDLSATTTQYVILNSTQMIYQIVTIPVTGYYNLTFNYTIQSGTTLNNVGIYINHTWFDTLPSKLGFLL